VFVNLQQNSSFQHGEVYSIQHYVIKFFSDLRQVGVFLRVVQFPVLIKLGIFKFVLAIAQPILQFENPMFKAIKNKSCTHLSYFPQLSCWLSDQGKCMIFSGLVPSLVGIGVALSFRHSKRKSKWRIQIVIFQINYLLGYRDGAWNWKPLRLRNIYHNLNGCKT
jgi:hypothetical protein